MPINNTINDITKECFDWCKDAYEIHQSNLRIEELIIVGIALISLFANRLIYTNSEWLIKNTEITESGLDMLHTSTYFFAFLLLILFLGYNIFFK